MRTRGPCVEEGYGRGGEGGCSAGARGCHSVVPRSIEESSRRGRAHCLEMGYLSRGWDREAGGRFLGSRLFPRLHEGITEGARIFRSHDAQHVEVSPAEIPIRVFRRASPMLALRCMRWCHEKLHHWHDTLIPLGNNGRWCRASMTGCAWESKNYASCTYVRYSSSESSL